MRVEALPLGNVGLKWEAERDVYLACRALNGNLKLSLHESGRWHMAFDAARFGNMFESSTGSDTRFAGKWDKPAPLVEGLTLACRVHTPWYAATIPSPNLEQNVSWIQCATPGHSIEVMIFLSESVTSVTGWPGQRSMNTSLVGTFDLDGGGNVWVVYHSIPLVEPILPPAPAPKYFKGAGELDLYSDGMRAVIWGDCQDGSIVLYEAPVSVTKNV